MFEHQYFIIIRLQNELVGRPTIEYYDNNSNNMNIEKNKYIENTIPDLDSEIKCQKGNNLRSDLIHYEHRWLMVPGVHINDYVMTAHCVAMIRIVNFIRHTVNNERYSEVINFSQISSILNIIGS